MNINESYLALIRIDSHFQRNSNHTCVQRIEKRTKHKEEIWFNEKFTHGERRMPTMDDERRQIKIAQLEPLSQVSYDRVRQL